MKRLKKGDTIGIFSPSAGITANAPKRHQRSIEFLEDQGFKVLKGSLTGKKDFYRSGSIEQRVDELNALIRNPEVRCIMSTIGGMNSNSLLPYIDYEAFKRDPKIIVGYSDVTAILLAIYAQTGLTTFYGPASVVSFGELSPYVDMTFEYFQSLLITEEDYPLTLETPAFWTDERIDWETQDRPKEAYENKVLCIHKGQVEGRLIGGNLNTFTGFWGSAYMPEIKKGDILFIEDSLKDIATIERSFSLLKVNGVFDRVAGIILGKHELFNDSATGRKPYEVLLEVLNGQVIPMIADFDCSHTHPMFTLPLGARIVLDADNTKVTLLEDPFTK